MITDPPALDDPTALLRQVTAQPAEAGARLDRLLAAHFADLSRTRLKHLVASGQVTADGATVSDPSLRVRAGQSFTLRLPPPIADRPVPQAMDLVIVYEDEHVIVIDKPAGLVVHPAPGNPDRTLVNALLAHCGASLSGIGGVRRPGIVHRLDKDTSGLMVAAKSERAHTRLAADFAARRITRAYQAVVWGVPAPSVGEIDAPIGRSSRDRKKMAVRESGKPALTRYRVLRAFAARAALIECRLATGRTHQIRVHLSARGHPLVGDEAYGGRRARAWRTEMPSGIADFKRQALHANVIGFHHPATSEYLTFHSPLPSDIEGLLQMLEQL
ncbi:MAG TPA: RluA family pseudouridine synthase [Stellaceae bacterium]|nr:RluA family pseudouridine synthase [Stellaceae bacterium]